MLFTVEFLCIIEKRISNRFQLRKIAYFHKSKVPGFIDGKGVKS